MLAWLLNLAYLLALAGLAPWIVFRIAVLGKNRDGWRAKLLGEVPALHSGRGCIWLHAVSVGEVLQLEPVVERLKSLRPDLDIAISVTTATGRDVARKRYAACTVFDFPLDFSWAVNRALDRIRPLAVVLVELELWPNLVMAAQRRQIPVLLINARVSERSFRGYRRIGWLMRRVLRAVAACAAQNDLYAKRLIELGADPNSIEVTGSIKFDRVQTDRTLPATCQLRNAFEISGDAPVFIAGSTQAPEERLAIETWLAARRQFPALRLILVPRHKERFEEVARLVTAEFGLPLLRRSTALTGTSLPQACLKPPGAPATDAVPPVCLLDTLGELAACWGLADVAFVGGSLTRRGGQNMIEPAGFGAVVLFGPNTWNFRDVVELLKAHDAAIEVANGAELASTLQSLLANPDRARLAGEGARQLVLAQRGATERTVNMICRVVGRTTPEQAFAA
jgi:3-deoxy-D-manno-octulosonic-acid transferase